MGLLQQQENGLEGVTFMKNALVLGGGGTKGIYQIGAVKAMRELGRDNWDIITGVSAGALNASLLVQGDFELLEYLYDHLESDQFVNGYLPEDFSISGLLRERKQIIPVISGYLKNDGVDVTPFMEFVKRCFDPERFFASDIDFGCLAAVKGSNEPVYVTKEMMRTKGIDWLVASSTAYPIFPVKVIDSVEYVDGGYADNAPIDFALRLGAEEVTCVEMHRKPLHSGYIGRKGITLIHPREELYPMFDFDHVKMQRAKRKGYLDTMKAFGVYAGIRYSFTPFGLPEEYAGWYRRVMLLEAQARMAGGRWSSETPVMDALVENSGGMPLDYTDMFFAALDVLMTIAGLDDEKVWTWQEAAKELRFYYAGAQVETTGAFDQVKPLLGRGERVASFIRLLKTGAQEDGQNIQYPFVTAMADFVSNVIG